MAREKFPIQGSGSSVTGSNFASHKFTSAEDWDPISGLSEEILVEVNIDFKDVTNGTIEIEVDGSVEIIAISQETIKRIVSASSSVSLNSKTSADIFDLSQLSFVSETTVPDQSGISGIYVKENGLSCWMINQGSSPDSIVEYSFTSPWDASTIATVQSKDLENNNYVGIFFKPDGTEFYTLHSTGGEDKAQQWSMTTAWDISTATLKTETGNLDATSNLQGGIYFSPDGKSFFFADDADDDCHEYVCLQPWELANITPVNDVVMQDAGVGTGFTFSPDGFNYYWSRTASGNDYIGRTVLAKSFDLSNVQLDVQEKQLTGIGSDALYPFFSRDGKHMLIITTDVPTVRIQEYDTTTAGTFTGTGFASINYTS